MTTGKQSHHALGTITSNGHGFCLALNFRHESRLPDHTTGQWHSWQGLLPRKAGTDAPTVWSWGWNTLARPSAPTPDAGFSLSHRMGKDRGEGLGHLLFAIGYS